MENKVVQCTHTVENKFVPTVEGDNGEAILDDMFVFFFRDKEVFVLPSWLYLSLIL